MSRRMLVESMLGRSGLAALRARQLRRCNRHVVRILAYHRIGTVPAGYRFDPDVFSATAEDFRRQMEFVRRYFSVVTFRDLAEVMAGRQEVPANPLVVTFDDGYRDNYSAAFPILRDLGLPATFFVVTDHMGTNRPFWWDEIAFMVPDAAQRAEALGAIKAQPDSDRESLLASLGTRPTEAEYAGQLMSWEQIAEMHKAGMEIGSHTRTHPVLANVGEPQLTAEVAGSRDILAERLGTAPVALAYPVGGRSRYNTAVLASVKKAGYVFGVTYEHGSNDTRRWQPYELRRVRVERTDRLAHFAGRLVFAEVL